MRTWFDRCIEGGLIVLAIYSVVEAGRIIVEIGKLH